MNHPMRADGARAGADGEEAAGALPPDLIHVLVIDDEVEICEQIASHLSGVGYRVAMMSDPAQALARVRPGAFHVIILDLVMPKVSGLELLDRIRQQDDQVAVIILTGHPTIESAVRSIQHSVSDYLQKPFKRETLQDAVDKILRRKGLLRTPEEALLTTMGQSMRQRRQEKKLTLKQMSQRTGLSPSTLSQIERAESTASISSLYKISVALGCTVTDLLGGL